MSHGHLGLDAQIVLTLVTSCSVERIQVGVCNNPALVLCPAMTSTVLNSLHASKTVEKKFFSILYNSWIPSGVICGRIGIAPRWCSHYDIDEMSVSATIGREVICFQVAYTISQGLIQPFAAQNTQILVSEVPTRGYRGNHRRFHEWSKYCAFSTKPMCSHLMQKRSLKPLLLTNIEIIMQMFSGYGENSLRRTFTDDRDRRVAGCL